MWSHCQFLETTGSEGIVAAGISLSCVVMALDYSQQYYCCKQANSTTAGTAAAGTAAAGTAAAGTATAGTAAAAAAATPPV
jgi:hypothetical protein